MRSDEIRRTNDQIVGSQLDKTEQAKSQDSGSKGLFEKARQYLGPASAALILGGVAFRGFVGIVGAEGSTPEAHSTALTQRDSGSDKAIGLPPAFPTDQRAGFIGKSPTEPYVPAPRPEWLSPYQGPTTQQLWPDLYDHMVKASGEKGQASKKSLQGEAQEIYEGEDSSGQAKPDKHKSRKLLSSHEEKIATMRALMDEAKENPEALQSFIKRLNDKKEREQSPLESNPEIVRLLQEQLGYTNGPYNYAQLTPTDAQAQLKYLQAFQEATQYLGKQPDWNNIYAYNGSIYDGYNTAGEKGIIAIYPSEGYSTTFLAINDTSSGNDTIGLLGQWVVQSSESAFLTWSTPQGKTFTAQVYTRGGEALVSGNINWGNFTFSPACFTEYSGFFSSDCNCQTNCSDCVLYVGPFGIRAAKQCLVTNSSDQYACLSVSLSGVEPGVQLWPYMIKISDELYVQNNCPWELYSSVEATVGFNYVCPPRTCPPGRAYYALENSTIANSSTHINPGERIQVEKFDTWVYCSTLTLNGTDMVNYISLPTTIDINIMASGQTLDGSSNVYSPNINFHVYDASMYPDLHPYPSIPSACGENDPNCTQLCARHPEATIPADTIPAQYPELRPPSPSEAPASPPEAPVSPPEAPGAPPQRPQ